MSTENLNLQAAHREAMATSIDNEIYNTGQEGPMRWCTKCGHQGPVGPEGDFYRSGTYVWRARVRYRSECKRCTHKMQRARHRRIMREIRAMRAGDLSRPSADPSRAQLQHARDREDRTIALACERLAANREVACG